MGIGKNKYRNKPMMIGDIRFDSQAEAMHYQRLLADPSVKEILLQPKFLLQEKFTHAKTGAKHQAITYVADFDVTYYGDRREIQDVKGMKTEVFKLKMKLFDYRYPDLILRLI